LGISQERIDGAFKELRLHGPTGGKLRQDAIGRSLMAS